MTFDTREWVAVAVGGAAIAGLVATSSAAGIMPAHAPRPAHVRGVDAPPTQPSLKVAFQHGGIQLAMN